MHLNITIGFSGVLFYSISVDENCPPTSSASVSSNNNSQAIGVWLDSVFGRSSFAAANKGQY